MYYIINFYINGKNNLKFKNANKKRKNIRKNFRKNPF